MSTEQATAAPSPPTVETDDGPITLATLGELKGLLAAQQARLQSLEQQAKELDEELQDRRADAGINLTYELTTSPSSSDLAARLVEARMLLERYRSLGAEVEQLRSETGFMKRLGDFWRGRVDVARPIDAAGVRAHVVHAQHPVLRQASLNADIPLVGARVQ